MSSMEVTPPEDLAVRIRDERKRRRMTQQEVAVAAGIGLRTYQMFEKGEGKTQPANLRAIKRAVGIDDEEPGNEVRESWPGEIKVFRDVMGAFLMTLSEADRLAFIHEETLRIIQWRDTH